MNKLIEFCNDNSILFKKNVLLKNHTTFKVGGPCKIMFFPDSTEKLLKIGKYVIENGYDYFVIGNGSNLLISDKGINKVVINTSEINEISLSDDNTVIASAGVSLIKLCKCAYDNSLSGMEFAYGIPGTVGGAVFMNAGAYGGEIKDVITEVTHLNDKGEIETLSSDKLDLSYRHSYYSDKNYIVLKIKFTLLPGNKTDIKQKMDELMSRRKSKQPLEYPSAGSTFKRPEGYYAGALIEECGLKGYSSNGACVSEKHAGFVINKNNATAEDILNVINHCRKTVFDKKGIMLEPEVKILN